MKALVIISLITLSALIGRSQTVKFYYTKTADVETHTMVAPSKDTVITAKLINPGKYKFRIAKVSVQVNVPSGQQVSMVAQTAAISYQTKIYTIDNADAKFSLSPTFNFKLPDVDYKTCTIRSFKVDEITAEKDEGQQLIDGTFYAKEVMVAYPLKTNPTMSAKGQRQ
ncbi:hypothetical protein [Mucilaginibacter agri]|uniref:Uncharacterized protein n=1 Tax=Mucilaginibacter agri TaxID=2695265 RepID=A0A966DT13_9SPHI|nr:hypothetical protein [Mucilaginibacter agri]NCD70165.1 hypothetical protein [Mucilaginibacter agri]